MLIGNVDSPRASHGSPSFSVGVLGRAPILALILAFAAPPSMTEASTVLSTNGLKAYSDVIVVGVGDFSDPNSPMTGVIRARRVLKGVRQAEYRIVVRNDYDVSADPPQWMPDKDRIRAKFYLVKQSDGRYFVLGTEGEK